MLVQEARKAGEYRKCGKLLRETVLGGKAVRFEGIDTDVAKLGIQAHRASQDNFLHFWAGPASFDFDEPAKRIFETSVRFSTHLGNVRWAVGRMARHTAARWTALSRRELLTLVVCQVFQRGCGGRAGPAQAIAMHGAPAVVRAGCDAVGVNIFGYGVSVPQEQEASGMLAELDDIQQADGSGGRGRMSVYGMAGNQIFSDPKFRSEMSYLI
ncbi:hypothetical protein CYMTET_50977 [Cymbomonas tetramitiformis]|uniref:Uncharacterized protein n=1 Tax=Cymbomonas tetramitiformis TaxID=36881 RepID=A0AAE0BM57_9CHLO|nr:hypothetical protein CYMTET_50977 [Cymbomonas tetramitiformis]